MKWNGMRERKRKWNARTEAEMECANGSGNEMREAGAEAEYNNSIL